ncbi:MAG: CotH kinase family protein, partial [Ruminiclostridium sp.]|nr:CotH kinase family protein [Ruminiclostridium sp.]
MKRLVILLVILIIAGAASIYLLENHADLQADLPTSYLTADEGMIPDYEAAEAALRINFSRKDAFSSEDITLELSCTDPDAMIYYTDDGNDPDRNSKIYTGPILLRAQSYEKCTTIKAFAADGDITGETAVKSYIVGTNMAKRFSRDTLVFVLSSDEYNLYDYYYGVATEGYLRDEFIHSDAFPGGDLKPTDPANYNIRGRESERPMYVEVFTSDGKQLISQAAGGRVVGGYSRAEDQKSWRLIARNLYSEGDGKFRYPFFNDAADAEGNFLTRYDRITLRNGANDREFAGIRDELSMTLAAQMGFPDTQAVTPAAVYLNGKYYGYAWLHEAYSTDYLESVYGGNKDNFRIVGSKELEPESDDPEDERAVADWEYVIGLAKKGFEDDAVYEEFCSLVDMDNLVLYYAMQLYIDNKDWPGNNFKVWRYYPEPGESAESEYLDGKWRFLFFDAEFAWWLYNKGFRDDTVHSVLIGTHMQGTSYILSALLSRPDTREKFADTVCELEGYAFSMDNVEKVLDDLIKNSDHEQMHALKAGKISSWANVFTFDNSRKQIRDFAAYRPINFNKNLAKTLEIKKTQYTVNLETPSGALVHLGAISLGKGESVSVKYFDEYSVTSITSADSIASCIWSCIDASKSSVGSFSPAVSTSVKAS